MKRALAVVVLAACSKEPAPERIISCTKGPGPDCIEPLAEKPHVTAPTTVAARPRPAVLTKVTIKALGMYCEESCPLKVRTALAEVPSVYELGFDLSNESIFVSYDATLGTPKDVTKPMLVAIKSAGFDPWLAKESWPDAVDAHVVTR